MRVKEEHGMKKSEKSVGISDKLGYMLGNLYFTLLSLICNLSKIYICLI